MSANQKNTATNDVVKKNQIAADQSKSWDCILKTGHSEKFNFESLRTLELQLKDIWSQYIGYFDKKVLMKPRKH